MSENISAPESRERLSARVAELEAKLAEAVTERNQWRTACQATVSGDYRALNHLKSIALNHAEAARSGVVAAIHVLEESAGKWTDEMAKLQARAVAAEAALREAREAQRRITKHVRFHRALGLEASTHGGDYGRGRAYGIECLADDIDAALAPPAWEGRNE